LFFFISWFHFSLVSVFLSLSFFISYFLLSVHSTLFVVYISSPSYLL
jgi:hypothetical protein